MTITWYKFHAHHGPGHQSHTTLYRPYEWDMSDEDAEEEWQRIFAHNEGAYGGWERLTKVPDEEVTRLVRDYLHRLEFARAVVASLIMPGGEA